MAVLNRIMKSSVLILLFGLSGTTPLVRAAEDPLPPPNRPDREALRERARAMSPEERQKFLREFRERHGLGGTNRSELEKRREELKHLPPAEREARLKELREALGPARQEFRLNREQREAKRGEMKERIDGQIAALEAKQSETTLSEPERRRLERMRQMSRRLSQNLPARPPVAAKPSTATPPAPVAKP